MMCVSGMFMFRGSTVFMLRILRGVLMIEQFVHMIEQVLNYDLAP